MDSKFACFGDVSDSQNFDTYFEPLKQPIGGDTAASGYEEEREETCPPHRQGITKSPEFTGRPVRGKVHKQSGTPSKGATTDCCSVDYCRKPGKEEALLRTFICNFVPTQVATDCQAKERERCLAFWNLVELRPELTFLMRHGEFIHEAAPIGVRDANLDLSERCFSAERLRARDKAIHDEERERCLKRREALKKLQQRSGQKIIKARRGGPVVHPKPSEEFKNFVDVVDEMNEFDVRCKNPVRTERNPPPKEESVDWGEYGGLVEEQPSWGFGFDWGEGEEQDKDKDKEVEGEIERVASVRSVARSANPSAMSLGFNNDILDDSHEEALAVQSSKLLRTESKMRAH